MNATTNDEAEIRKVKRREQVAAAMRRFRARKKEQKQLSKSLLLEETNREIRETRDALLNKLARLSNVHDGNTTFEKPFPPVAFNFSASNTHQSTSMFDYQPPHSEYFSQSPYVPEPLPLAQLPPAPPPPPPQSSSFRETHPQQTSTFSQLYAALHGHNTLVPTTEQRQAQRLGIQEELRLNDKRQHMLFLTATQLVQERELTSTPHNNDDDDDISDEVAALICLQTLQIARDRLSRLWLPSPMSPFAKNRPVSVPMSQINLVGPIEECCAAISGEVLADGTLVVRATKLLLANRLLPESITQAAFNAFIQRWTNADELTQACPPQVDPMLESTYEFQLLPKFSVYDDDVNETPIVQAVRLTEKFIHDGREQDWHFIIGRSAVNKPIAAVWLALDFDVALLQGLRAPNAFLWRQAFEQRSQSLNPNIATGKQVKVFSGVRTLLSTDVAASESPGRVLTPATEYNHEVRAWAEEITLALPPRNGSFVPVAAETRTALHVDVLIQVSKAVPSFMGGVDGYVSFSGELQPRGAEVMRRACQQLVSYVAEACSEI